MNETNIALLRDVEATQVPSGDRVTLAQGSVVGITQALGGTYTVHVEDRFGLYRIRAEDGDALGKDPAHVRAGAIDEPYDEAKVWEQLRNCYDPEIPVNIVDLGLIYSMEATDDADSQGKHIAVAMTLTAPGCGMGPSIAADAELRILGVPGVASAKVEIVWDPPWSPERISPEGKEKLGMM
jgi:probable FeS assembly SUF system protein SufT